MTTASISRRAFLQSTGALIVSFSLPLAARAQTSTPPDKLAQFSSIDAWLAIGRDGNVTMFSGKVELGTGVETALAQIVAEELDVAVERVIVVQGDTARTPDQGLTTGSKTIQQGAPQLRQAAAAARETLLGLASARLAVPPEQLVVQDGVVSVRGDDSRRVSYGELIGGHPFNRPVTKAARPKSPEQYTIVGQPVRRVDLPAKAMGTYPFVHNLRVAGMVHGRVIRPSGVSASLASIDEDSVRSVPGLIKVMRNGNFVGVVAEREEQAIRAARELKVTWQDSAGLPEMKDLFATIRNTPSTERVLIDVGDPTGALASAARSLHATYRWPFQMHASIGPSCAVADVRKDQATIWSGSQGVFGLRDAVAKLLQMPPENVRVVFLEPSGCYGHNGADDVAADAALLSQAVGRPVRVQWMRQDEHGWEPKGPAMVMDVRAGLDGQGNVVAWDYAVWTSTHSTRPRSEAGNLLAGQLTGIGPRVGLSGGDRNAKHTYAFKNDRVVVHWLSTSPLRPSALRGLGAPQNTFANESFMDELAAAAGVDPVEFRLRHLTDPRAIAVIEAAAKRAGWTPRPSPKTGGGTDLTPGRGIAYLQYETATAYTAAVVDVEVNRQTGAVRVSRVAIAHDCGLIINPDGLRNQIEGNVVQAISRSLKEEVKFDRSRVTSLDWSSYPILTFPEAPDEVVVELINRPHIPPVGAGEPATCPIPAAIANAIFDATGVRLRTVPFTPDRVKAAMEGA